MIRPRRARLLAHAAAAVAAALAVCALAAVAQPPLEEEEKAEVLKGRGPKKRVAVEEDPVVPGKGTAAAFGTPPDVRLDELARGAEEPVHPRVKELFLQHAVPFDRLTTKSGTVRIKPIPVAPGDQLPRVFGIQELERDGTPLPPEGVNAGEVLKRECFEDIARAEADAVLAARPFGTAPGPQGWTAQDQLAAAERLLGAAMRFHDFARERNIRKGKLWDEVRRPLADRLRAVRLDQLRIALKLEDWPRAREVGTRLMAGYPKDDVVRDVVAAARVSEAKKLLAGEAALDHLRAKRLLDEFEATYPGGGGDGFRALRAELSRRAADALARARAKREEGDLTAARDALRRAVDLDPNAEGVGDLRRDLKVGYQTLVVGVRQFPLLMSPGTAKLDSERQAVELLFDGLLAEVPDDGAGARYRPGAALALPAVGAAAREFQLRTFDPSATGQYGFEAQDVVGTLELLGARADTWAGYPLAWLDKASPRDNATVRVPLRLGHPDPRALFAFKVLPARWMSDNRVTAADPRFGEAPLGTGPFRLAPLKPNPKGDPKAPRERVFVENPVYARAADRAGQPFIKEVRFVELTKDANSVEAFQLGGLHVLTDVPTAELNAYRVALAGTAQDYTAANNRRVHLLAVNHRRPALQNKGLRQGLSQAIDRESILTDVFRAGRGDVHRPLTGPFPPQSWAAARGLLLNRDLAQTRLRAYLVSQVNDVELSLAYPSDDPRAEEACKRIKAQVEGLVKDGPGRKLVLALTPLPPRDLLVRVEDEHRFDLAYVPFDYPDDWYPFALGAMLDPDAGKLGGRNWTGFLTDRAAPDGDDARLGQLLSELRAYRDFGTLAGKTAEVQKLFNDCVPFIPLWQLDRHLLVHNSVKVFTDESDAPVSPRTLNPTTLFNGVARWKME